MSLPDEYEYPKQTSLCSLSSNHDSDASASSTIREYLEESESDESSSDWSTWTSSDEGQHN